MPAWIRSLGLVLSSARPAAVSISLPWRNGTIPRQSRNGIGQLIELTQQDPSAVQTLGFLGIAGATYMSY